MEPFTLVLSSRTPDNEANRSKTFLERFRIPYKIKHRVKEEIACPQIFYGQRRLRSLSEALEIWQQYCLSKGTTSNEAGADASNLPSLVSCFDDESQPKGGSHNLQNKNGDELPTDISELDEDEEIDFELSYLADRQEEILNGLENNQSGPPSPVMDDSERRWGSDDGTGPPILPKPMPALLPLMRSNTPTSYVNKRNSNLLDDICPLRSDSFDNSMDNDEYFAPESLEEPKSSRPSSRADSFSTWSTREQQETVSSTHTSSTLDSSCHSLPRIPHDPFKDPRNYPSSFQDSEKHGSNSSLLYPLPKVIQQVKDRSRYFLEKRLNSLKGRFSEEEDTSSEDNHHRRCVPSRRLSGTSSGSISFYGDEDLDISRSSRETIDATPGARQPFHVRFGNELAHRRSSLPRPKASGEGLAVYAPRKPRRSSFEDATTTILQLEQLNNTRACRWDQAPSFPKRNISGEVGGNICSLQQMPPGEIQVDLSPTVPRRNVSIDDSTKDKPESRLMDDHNKDIAVLSDDPPEDVQAFMTLPPQLQDKEEACGTKTVDMENSTHPELRLMELLPPADTSQTSPKTPSPESMSGMSNFKSKHLSRSQDADVSDQKKRDEEDSKNHRPLSGEKSAPSNSMTSADITPWPVTRQRRSVKLSQLMQKSTEGRFSKPEESQAPPLSTNSRKMVQSAVFASPALKRASLPTRLRSEPPRDSEACSNSTSRPEFLEMSSWSSSICRDGKEGSTDKAKSLYSSEHALVAAPDGTERDRPVDAKGAEETLDICKHAHVTTTDGFAENITSNTIKHLSLPNREDDSGGPQKSISTIITNHLTVAETKKAEELNSFNKAKRLMELPTESRIALGGCNLTPEETDYDKTKLVLQPLRQPQALNIFTNLEEDPSSTERTSEELTKASRDQESTTSKPLDPTSVMLELSFLMDEIFLSGCHEALGSGFNHKLVQRYMVSAPTLKMVSLKFSSDQERIAFSLNLFNCMMRHAIIGLSVGDVNLPPFPQKDSDLKSFLSRICYNVGGNLINLADVQSSLFEDSKLGVAVGTRSDTASVSGSFRHWWKQLLASTSLDCKQSATCSIMPSSKASSDPRLVFCISYGTATSPRVKTINPRQFERHLRSAAETFCQRNVSIIPNKLKGCVIKLPQLFHWYRNKFGGASRERIVESIIKYLSRSQMETLVTCSQNNPSRKWTIRFQKHKWELPQNPLPPLEIITPQERQCQPDNSPIDKKHGPSNPAVITEGLRAHQHDGLDIDDIHSAQRRSVASKITYGSELQSTNVHVGPAVKGVHCLRSSPVDVASYPDQKWKE